MSKYELLASDPHAPASAKLTKMKGVKAVKAPKTTTITEMSTLRIVLYVLYRHRVGILATVLILSWAYFVVTGMPGTVKSLRG